MGTDESISWNEDMTTVLKRLSAGWTARYQVFSIENEPELVFDLECHLDKLQIWTQIRQSLWKDGPGTVADTCRLQFPISIGKSLQRFSVLRDVYTPYHESDGKPASQIATLPLEFNDAVQDAWMGVTGGNYDLEANPEKFLSLDSWTHRNCRLYLYWVWLSMDSRYAFFIDKAPSKSNNIAVYDLDATDSTSAPLLLNYLSAHLYRGNKEIHCDAVTFHPIHALVVFTVLGCVYLWAYQYGNVARSESNRGPC